MGEVIDFDREQMIDAVINAGRKGGQHVSRSEAEEVVDRVFSLFRDGVSLLINEREGKFEIFINYDEKLGHSLLEVVVCLHHMLGALKQSIRESSRG